MAGRELYYFSVTQAVSVAGFVACVGAAIERVCVTAVSLHRYFSFFFIIIIIIIIIRRLRSMESRYYLQLTFAGLRKSRTLVPDGRKLLI